MRILIGLLILGGVYLFLRAENRSVGSTEHDLQFVKLPQAFDGLRIVQVSDFHSGWFGPGAGAVARKVKKARPDLIVVTGDLVDNTPFVQRSIDLMEKLTQIAPVYFVHGNHEWTSGRWSKLEEDLRQLGVTVLRNSRETIARGVENIQLVGLDDPLFLASQKKVPTEALREALYDVRAEEFTILLCHRPELLPLYSAFQLDLIFTGHAHGGQVRVPWVGGMVAPHQGFFPSLTSGVHRAGSSVMVINRGLGNSIIPQRLFNRPEIILMTLHSTNLTGR